MTYNPDGSLSPADEEIIRMCYELAAYGAIGPLLREYVTPDDVSGFVDGVQGSPVSSLDLYPGVFPGLSPGEGENVSFEESEPSTFDSTWPASAGGSWDLADTDSSFASPVEAEAFSLRNDGFGQHSVPVMFAGDYKATPTPQTGSWNGESTDMSGQSNPSHAQRGERPQRREPTLAPNGPVPSGPTDTSHPSKCHFCSRRYTNNSNRNQHEREKHGERPKRSGRPRKALQPVIIS